MESPTMKTQERGYDVVASPYNLLDMFIVV